MALLPIAPAFHHAYYGVHQRLTTSSSYPLLFRPHPQRIGKLSSLTALESTKQPPPSVHTTYTFVSPTYHVYIEDTDTYGVMYNGNYIRCYERALSHVPRHNDDSSYSWIVSSVTNQKFRSSPSLGEEYVIRGMLLEQGNENGGPSEEVSRRRKHDEEVWQLEMTTRRKKISNNGDNGIDDDENSWIVHNSATVTILNTLRYPSSSSIGNIAAEKTLLDSIPPPPQLDDHDCGAIFEQRCTAYIDEFDTLHFKLENQQQQQQSSSYRPQHILPLRNAMNFFERSRTNYLGGPAALRKMQVDADILWVVTSVDDGEVTVMLDEGSNFGSSVENDMKGGSGTSEKAKDASPVRAMPSTMATSRRDVIIRTNFVVKRRGMIVECRHELFMDQNDSDVIGLSDEDDNKSELLGHTNTTSRILLAKATVTVMALNGSTRRPTSNLPQWILDQIMGTTLN